MTREDLQNCRKAALAREAMRERIRELREDACSVGGMRYDNDTPHGRGEVLSRQQRYVEAAERLAARYAEIAAHWAQQALAAEQALGALPPDLQELMRLRYVEGWKWEKVNGALYISEATSKRMHRKALGLLGIG